ncbi:MAG: GNAT family N-acetyltransferase [Alphaproteobacteria bacterium]|nr:GNAT family N-acetyltransferase [Alphaproteobacteria bacterium]
MAEPRATTEAAEITLRDLDRTDFDWLLALNNASVPHVNHLEQADLAEILALAAYARGSFRDGAPAGALIALRPGTAYASSHYRWFVRHHSDFLYIDRVMIDDAARQGGHGRRLYADIERFARESGAGHLACEVNSQPPNPVSMGFHEALGFRPVGELANEDRSKCVVLLMKPIDGRPAGLSE